MKTLITLFTATLIFVSESSNAQADYVALYQFNGDGNDASGNGYNGTLSGGASITNNNLIIGDNDSDAFSIPYETVNGLGDFTISFRFMLSAIHLSGSFPGNTFIHAWGAQANQDGLKISIDGEHNEFQVSINTVEYLGIHQFSANTWYRAKVIRSGSVLSMYIDKNLIASFSNVSENPIQAASGGVIIGQEQDCLGGCYAQNQSLYGRIGRFAILDYAQFKNSTDEEALLRESGSLVFYPNPANNAVSIMGDFILDSEYEIELIGINGAIVNSKSKFSGSSLSFNVTKVPDGIYFVRILQDDKFVASGKIKVQH